MNFLSFFKVFYPQHNDFLKLVVTFLWRLTLKTVYPNFAPLDWAEAQHQFDTLDAVVVPHFRAFRITSYQTKKDVNTRKCLKISLCLILNKETAATAWLKTLIVESHRCCPVRKIKNQNTSFEARKKSFETNMSLTTHGQNFELIEFRVSKLCDKVQ